MKRAAVLLPIVAATPPTLLFVERAHHLRRNPGQIAFPGGFVDSGDADDRAAALREFEEELGLPADAVRVVARLEDVETPTRPPRSSLREAEGAETAALDARLRRSAALESVTVAPFVGIVGGPVAPRIDPAETARVVEVPLAEIYAPGRVFFGIERIGPYDVPSWLFDDGDVHVWGATGRMLHDLLARFPSIDRLPLREDQERRGSPAR